MLLFQGFIKRLVNAMFSQCFAAAVMAVLANSVLFQGVFFPSLDQINLPLHFCFKQITPPPFPPKHQPLSDPCALLFLSMHIYISRFLDYNPGSSKATDEICGIEIHIFKGFNFLRDIPLYIPGLKPTLVFISTYGRGLK